MFLYDWGKIFEAGEQNPLAIFLIFKMLVKRQIPKNKYDKIYKYSKIDFSGKSFLVNAEALVYNSYQYSYREIAQYLAIASVRAFADYAATGDLTVDIRKFEFDPILIEDNRLLRIEDNRVYLKYEEATKEKLH
jgi:hypothetical protein